MFLSSGFTTVMKGFIFITFLLFGISYHESQTYSLPSPPRAGPPSLKPPLDKDEVGEKKEEEAKEGQKQMKKRRRDRKK